MLYIVPTPIGNLKDITLRALEVLQSVDEIICEDTRHTGILLNHFAIKKPLIILNDFNESKNYPQIIEKLKNGQNLALVSDAGTPLISDPGYKLIRECLSQNIQIDSLPGPVAAITALTLSGLPPNKFFFLGYLPEKSGHRKKLLNSLTAIHDSINVTFIIYIAPHKLLRTLNDLMEILGDKEIVLAKELTKIYQKVSKKNISEFLNEFQKSKPKGEYILLFNLKAY